MYNVDTQLLYLAILIHDNNLFTKVKSIIKPEYFNDQLRKTVKFVLDYNDEYSGVPSHEQVKALAGTDIPKLDKLDIDGEKWFIDEFPNFCRHKALELATYATSQYIQAQDYDVIEELYRDALGVRLISDYGLDYAENAEERLRDIKNRNGNTSSGFATFDSILGKLNSGDLIIYTGGSGTGKSLFLQNHAINHWVDGLSVVMITLELHPQLVARRMDAMFMGVSTTELYNDLSGVANAISLKQKKSKGLIKIKYMPSGSTTSEIRDYLKLYITETGRKVDILIIDYLDCVNPVGKFSASDTFTKDKLASEQLRNIGQEYGPTVITASQLNRSSVNVDELDHSHIAGGISKINTADIVLGIRSDNSLKSAGKYELQILKSRNTSGTGSKYPLLYNRTTMKITDDPEYLSNINSYKASNMSIKEQNDKLHENSVNKALNELQNAMNKGNPNVEQVDPNTGKSYASESDAAMARLKSLTNKAWK